MLKNWLKKHRIQEFWDCASITVTGLDVHFKVDQDNIGSQLKTKDYFLSKVDYGLWNFDLRQSNTVQ